MEDAISEYIRLRGAPSGLLMSRFVCPVGWLVDFRDRWPQQEEPVLLAVLGTSLEGVQQDLRLIDLFEEQMEGRAAVETYEVKAQPADVTADSLRRIQNVGYEMAYLELPWVPESLEAMAAIADYEGLGVKGRTGGLESSAFPNAEDLASWIQECVNLDLPLKLTAGLHHPWPHHNASIPADEHGFLNILAALALASEADLNRRELAEVLQAETLADGAGLAWNGEKIQPDALMEARAILHSIGSCSIDEPWHDLQQLL